MHVTSCVWYVFIIIFKSNFPSVLFLIIIYGLAITRETNWQILISITYSKRLKTIGFNNCIIYSKTIPAHYICTKKSSYNTSSYFQTDLRMETISVLVFKIFAKCDHTFLTNDFSRIYRYSWH